MSKYREDEAYLAYLALKEKNKTQAQNNNNDDNNKNDNNNDDILEPSTLDNMRTKIENIESMLNDIYTHLDVESASASKP
jgi:hypothetical protein